VKGLKKGNGVLGYYYYLNGKKFDEKKYGSTIDENRNKKDNKKTVQC
jgi:hypothetical protein